jgi:AraC-like DNA-binding protein
MGNTLPFFPANRRLRSSQTLRWASLGGTPSLHGYAYGGSIGQSDRSSGPLDVGCRESPSGSLLRKHPLQAIDFDVEVCSGPSQNRSNSSTNCHLGSRYRNIMVVHAFAPVGYIMVYLEQIPSLALRSRVKSLWYCHAPKMPHGRERVLPNGCMQIILNLSREYLIDCGEDGTAHKKHSRGIVVGVRDRYQVVDTADMEETVGVVIRPGGFTGLFRERADFLFQRVIALEDIWHEPLVFEQLEEPLAPFQKLQRLDNLLTGLAGKRSRRSELTDQALYLLRVKHLSVAECARSIGISERRLSQLFREEVGASPKLWDRIQRFQAVTRALHSRVDTPWAEMALNCGYYDQSHFANDFRTFSGLDASAYSKHVNQWQNHVTLGS